MVGDPIYLAWDWQGRRWWWWMGGTLGLGGAAVAGIGRGGGGGVPYSVMGMAGMVVVGGVYRGAVLGGAGVRH